MEEKLVVLFSVLCVENLNQCSHCSQFFSYLKFESLQPKCDDSCGFHVSKPTQETNRINIDHSLWQFIIVSLLKDCQNCHR